MTISQTGDNKQDLISIFSVFGNLSDSLNNAPLTIAYNSIINIVLTDGGFPNTDYTGKFQHNLGYPPMFYGLLNSAANGQFVPLPTGPLWTHQQGFQFIFSISCDAQYLTAHMTFGPVTQGSPPFYPVGQSFQVLFYLFNNPIVT